MTWISYKCLRLYLRNMFKVLARICMVMFIIHMMYLHSPQMVMLTFLFGVQLKRSMYDYKLYVSLLIFVYSLMDSDERASLQKKTWNVKPYLCMLRMSLVTLFMCIKYACCITYYGEHV